MQAYGFVRSAENLEQERRASAGADAAARRASAQNEEGCSLLTTIARKAARTRWIEAAETVSVLRQAMAGAGRDMYAMD